MNKFEHDPKITHIVVEEDGSEWVPLEKFKEVLKELDAAQQLAARLATSCDFSYSKHMPYDLSADIETARGWKEES